MFFFSKLYWVLVGLMIFMISYYINDIMIGYTELYWVLLNYFWVVLGFTEFHWLSMDFTGLNWVLLV